MRQKILSVVLGLTLLVIPATAFGATVPWDRPAVGRINPLYLLDTVYGNIFHATSTTQASIFPYASTTAISSSYASSTSGVFGSLTIGTLSGFLKATAGAVSTALINLTSDITGILPVANGGTGWGSLQSNTILLGNGTGAVATTTAGTNGFTLALVNGVPTWVATTTLSTITGTLTVAKGGTNSTSFPSSMILTSNNAGDTVVASSTPTAARYIATSSTASVFPYASSTAVTISGTASTTNLIVSSAGGSGTRCAQFAVDGTISATSAACGSGSGTVTSVGLSSTNSTLTVGSTPVTTSGTITADLNLAHGNTWSALQQFANASSSLFSVLGPLTVGTTSTTTIWGNATSTFAGINIPTGAGCFAINSVCIGGSSGLTSIGPVGALQTGPAITIATSSTAQANDWFVSATGNAITFNIPDSSTSNRGLLTSGNFTTFNNKISSTSLSGASVISYTSATGILTTAPGTFGGAGTYSTPQKFGVASTSPFGSLGVNPIAGDANQFVVGSSTATSFIINNAGKVGIGTTTPAQTFGINGSDFYVRSTGEVTGVDAANSFVGRITPTNHLSLQTGTTTTWTATTSSAYIPFTVAPFAGTLQQMRCKTDASFVSVEAQINGSDVTPAYIVASTTVGVVKLTAGNTFSAGDKISMINGTSTTATTASVSCTFDATETP